MLAQGLTFLLNQIKNLTLRLKKGFVKLAKFDKREFEPEDFRSIGDCQA